MKGWVWLWLGVALVVVGVILTATAAHAVPSFDERTIVRGPIVCRPIYCHQEKVSTIYRHGQPTLVLTWRHKRVAESRDSYTTPAWLPWHLEAVTVRPVA